MSVMVYKAIATVLNRAPAYRIIKPWGARRHLIVDLIESRLELGIYVQVSEILSQYEFRMLLLDNRVK